MQNHFLSESPSKQETISRQRRERARSDGLDESYIEEVIQKKMLVEEPADTENSEMMHDEAKPSKGSTQSRGKKARATSLTVIKNTPSHFYQNPLEPFNKRDLIPLSLQKQLNGSRRNKKLSLDESISKLKTPSGKSLAKNIDKMRLLSAVQQQEIEAIIRGRNSFYSSNSGGCSQISSPLMPLSNREGSMSPQNVPNGMYIRNPVNPNPSQFSRGPSEFTTDYNPSATDSDMMSVESRNQMNYMDHQKIEYSLSNQNNLLDPNIQQQQIGYMQNPAPFDLQGQNQVQTQWPGQRNDFSNLDVNFNAQNGGQMNYQTTYPAENAQDDGNFTSSFNIYNQTQLYQQQQQAQQQQQFLQQQGNPPFSTQIRIVQDSPKSSFTGVSNSQLTHDRSGYSPYAGEYSSPSRRGDQEPSYEQSFSTTANGHLTSNIVGRPKSTSTPTHLAEEQLRKVEDVMGQKSNGTPTSNSSNKIPRVRQHNKRSNSYHGVNFQEKLNLVSNLNTLQLQSNIVPEKYINSPHQGLSPAISRTNTDPTQLKSLIKSMRAEKQTLNIPLQNELPPQNDQFYQGGEPEEGPPLMHTGGGGSMIQSTGGVSLMHTGGGSLMNSGPPLMHTGGAPLLHPGGGSLAYLEDSSCNEGGSLFHTGGGSLMHTGGGGGLFGQKQKAEPAWDPFGLAPSITTAKTDNTDIKNYILSKTNPNYLNAPVSNFRENFPSKPLLKPQNHQFDDASPPLVTRTKTDPNDVKDLIKSFRKQAEPTSPFSPFRNNRASFGQAAEPSSPFNNLKPRNDSPPLLQNFSQPGPLNNDQLYSNPNFFGQNPLRRINTNPDHLASLIKSMHTNKNSNSNSPGLQQSPNSDFPFPRSDSNQLNSMKTHQPGFPIIDSIPSLGDLEVQNPITRTNTDPTDWRSFIKGRQETRASQFAHQKENNYNFSNHGSNNPSKTNITLNETHSSLGTPVFNQEANIDFNNAANFPFGVQMKQQQPQQQYTLGNPMSVYRTRTDPTSIRSLIHSNNQNR